MILRIPVNRLNFKISDQNKILLLSFIVGVLSGCAAVILDFAIELISYVLNGNIWGSLDYEFSFLVLPGVGMLVSLLLLKFVVKDNIGHGVTKVLLAISRNESKIKPHNMWSSVLTSSFKKLRLGSW